jgi:hypothetical protein
LTAIAAAIGTGRLIPGLTGADAWPVLGIGIGFGARPRLHRLRGRFAGIDARFLWLVTMAGFALVVATLVVMAVEGGLLRQLLN